MKRPQWAVQFKEANARAYYTIVTLSVGIVIANLVLFALLIKTDPRTIRDLLQTLIFFCVLGAMMNLTERVSKLERAGKTTGGFTDLVADAKAAAKLAGVDEEGANAIAGEVLSTCVRKAGGWQP
jgi:hypothetical protein